MIAQRIDEIKNTLPEGVSLIAVSKYHPDELIMEAYEAGQRLFGENKVQEMTGKYERLPKDIKWHFIGHLQTNKVKYIAPYVAMIHSIDSYRLLCEVNRQAARCNRVVDCLLQLHVAQEETKFGLLPNECRELLENEPWHTLEHVRLCGIMGMASNTDNTAQVQAEFASLHAFFSEIKSAHFSNAPHFKEISMGMSHDYKLAVEQGSTLVRIGSSIFGERQYI